ncbi:LysR family transcriptional regulator [Sphingobium sp. EM0848]|uniref:LysR family transcriptional regulator n=1 Tax=Sphingobium sp. EM0848 TaxID=2743473 RepID=UPI00159C1FC6|nr:LysR family transcriptional regulator [Sphingobium sp. EM0848]
MMRLLRSWRFVTSERPVAAIVITTISSPSLYRIRCRKGTPTQIASLLLFPRFWRKWELGEIDVKNALRNLRRIRHVVTLARRGSYARASIDLNMSQSALSRSIQSIEADLGFEIFTRAHRGTLVTAPGAIFVREASAFLAAADNMEYALRGLDARALDTIAFGIGPLPASVILPHLFIDELTDEPSLRINSHIQQGVMLLDLLDRKEIEFAICAREAIEDRPDLHIEQLFLLPVTPRARAGHPLLGKQDAAEADLRAYPMIGGTISPMARRAVILTGAFAYNPLIACDNYHLLADVVRATDAICIFATSFKTDGLGVIDCAEEAAPRQIPIMLARPRGEPLSPKVVALVDRIATIATGLHSDGR